MKKRIFKCIIIIIFNWKILTNNCKPLRDHILTCVEGKTFDVCRFVRVNDITDLSEVMDVRNANDETENENGEMI